MAEQLNTRYRILISDDGGTTWTYLGSQDTAGNRDTALRAYFATKPPAEGQLVVAAAESSFRPMLPSSRVTMSLTEQPLPGEAAEPAAEPVVDAAPEAPSDEDAALADLEGRTEAEALAESGASL